MTSPAGRTEAPRSRVMLLTPGLASSRPSTSSVSPVGTDTRIRSICPVCRRPGPYSVGIRAKSGAGAPCRRASLVAMLVAVAIASSGGSAGAAADDDGAGPRREVRAGGPAGAPGRRVRSGRALPAERRRDGPRRPERGAARALGGGRARQGRTHGRGPRRRAHRLPPRLPGQPARGGLRLRGVGRRGGHRAHDVRARGHRGGPGRPAGAPVLVLLPVQRLHQQARGRLGDDPARLRRHRRGGGARRDTAGGRVQPARGPRGRRVGRPEAAGRRRHPSRRARGRRLARQLLRLRALPRYVGGAGFRLRRHPHPERRRAAGRQCHPRRPGGGARGLPLDRLPGAVGAARGVVLQRADGPEHQGQLDAPDLVPGGQRPRRQLRRAGRRARRHLRHRLLLLRGLQRVRGRPQARRQPRAPAPDPGRDRAPGGLPGPSHDLEPGRTAAHRPAAGHRAGDPRRQTHVRVTMAAVRRDRLPHHPRLGRRRLPAGPDPERSRGRGRLRPAGRVAGSASSSPRW